MIENYKAWNLTEAIKYYSATRNKPEDIYESERVLFFPLINRVKTVLDIGCAAGGFYNILHSLNPGIKYTGVDVSEKMIKSARKLFPGIDFRLSFGNKLDFSDNSFDLIISLGVLHHIPGYKDLIRECYRVSKRYCLLDLPRLVPYAYKFDIKNSYMLLKERFHSKRKIDAVQTKVPYVLVDAAEIFNFLSDGLKPKRILAKGYFGKCDSSVSIPVEEVCFVVVCIEKSKSGKAEIIADLPGKILEYLKKKKIKFSEPFERILK